MKYWYYLVLLYVWSNYYPHHILNALHPQATVEEMYRGEFEVGSTKFTLDIEDTSGTFAWDFPAMVEVSL